MSLLDQEELRIILLDTRNRILAIETLYRGNLNSSAVRVGEVFKGAIRRNAAAIILCHNHPSSDPSPSPDDVQVTLAGVQGLADTVIITHGVGRQRGRAYVGVRLTGVFADATGTLWKPRGCHDASGCNRKSFLLPNPHQGR